MADTKKQDKKSSLIDPIYDRFVRGVTRAIGSTEFYEFFMDSISRAQNQFQFSNRKMIKTVDEIWVDEIEESLASMQNIIASPRNVIKEEDLIVNVVNAKRPGAETIRHLAQHSGMVESFDEGRGEVRPSKLMQRFREESTELYENRLVFTALEHAHHFVKIRHDALLESMSDEFGAKLKVCSDMDSATEHVHMETFLHIKEIDSPLDTDQKNGDVFARISRIYRVLNVFMNSSFAQQFSKLPRVKGTINRTNVLKRNPDYKAAVKLYEFLRNYRDIGYTIRIVEQSPEINERFQTDIYRNILFQYLILKSYLENEEDRTIPTKPKGRRRTLKPKFIHQIVEELTEDYNLPDVEIRKVLIEELTKEQLMQEEAKERLRLVEEQEQRRNAEAEQKAAQERAERERIAAEEAAEQERLRLEREAEEQRKKQERMEREAKDRRYRKLFQAELAYFEDGLEARLDLREQMRQEQREHQEYSDYADAVRMLEEAEARQIEEAQRERQRRKEEKERLAYQKAAESARATREEAEEQERMRQSAMTAMEPYRAELERFSQMLPERLRMRRQQEEQRRRAKEDWERRRLARRAKQHT